jgi:hypothetical protein
MIRNISRVTAILLFALVNITTLPTTVKAQDSKIAQASKTRKIVVNEFGYSFDVPTWARVVKDGSRGGVILEILKENYYKQRQRGRIQGECFYGQGTTLFGCAEFHISIIRNGRKELAETHKFLTTVCYCDAISGPKVYKGNITVNKRTYRKYETGDEGALYNIYLYLTKKNHLVSIVLYKDPYPGDRDALVTVMGSFKE